MSILKQLIQLPFSFSSILLLKTLMERVTDYKLKDYRGKQKRGNEKEIRLKKTSSTTTENTNESAPILKFWSSEDSTTRPGKLCHILVAAKMKVLENCTVLY